MYLCKSRMNINSGVNPVQSDSVSTEINVNSETISYTREPPPPYTPGDLTVTNQPIIHHTIIIQPTLKDGPMYYTCPRCSDNVLTKVVLVNTKKTHMLAGFVCGFTCWCLLCCLAAIPYFVPTFKRVDHYCPYCNTLLGTYSKL